MNFETIYIDQRSLSSQVAQRILELYPANQVQITEGKPPLESSAELTAEQFKKSKRVLYITEHPGYFFKRCPGAKKGLSCCNYYVLNLGLQCNMDCSYCYLQSFINTPYTMIYSNIDRAVRELDELYKDNSQQSVRVGTGEVIDSLSLDPISLYSRDLISCFKSKPNWNLEFKTKSSKVDQFLDCDHGGNVIVSWSINPLFITETEEHGTANLIERLEAAEKCLTKGFRIAFHVDPVIWYPEWQQGYKEMVLEITKRFQPTDMPYISLGALRFQPEQKNMMRERFGMKSWVTRAETFKSVGGKMRYDQRLREEMFKYIINEFKQQDSKWNIFLCMETPETWLNATATNPFKDENLRGLFKPIRL